VALPHVDAIWRSTLDPVGVQMTLQGIVCHGHPWIRYRGAASRCELGDFLLVHEHKPDTGPLERRAVIVQAKIFHRSGVRAKNSIQLDLYRRWPRFTYESWPGGIGNLAAVHNRAGLKDPLPALRERELAITGAPGSPPASAVVLDDACRYGMIDLEYSRWGDPKTGMNPWRLCSAQARNVYTSKDGLTLGSYLVRLMDGQVGRRVTATQWPRSVSVACHWSLMVMELLSIFPGASMSTVGSIAFLSATPNLRLGTGAQFRQTPLGKDEEDEGTFGIIRVQTSGDIRDGPRLEDETTRG
jgi:hypothetical protein